MNTYHVYRRTSDGWKFWFNGLGKSAKDLRRRAAWSRSENPTNLLVLEPGEKPPVCKAKAEVVFRVRGKPFAVPNDKVEFELDKDKNYIAQIERAILDSIVWDAVVDGAGYANH